MKRIFVILLTVLSLTSCDQTITRNFGGTTTVNLEPGEKLIEVTWKNYNVWYLVEPMESDYIPKTKIFKENSRVGILEGKVIFIERR